MPVEDLNSEAVDPSVEFAGYTCWRFAALKLQVFVHPMLYRATVNATLLASKAKKPSEIGGILLGNVIRGRDWQSVVINEINGVASESPFFNTTANDLRALQTALQRMANDVALPPVGYFRSHLREGPVICRQDLEFFGNHVGDGPALFLVMKPEGNTSCLPQFCLWSDGRLQIAALEPVSPRVSLEQVAGRTTTGTGASASFKPQPAEESVGPYSQLSPPSSAVPKFAPARDERFDDEDSFWTRGHLTAVALFVVACFAGFLFRPLIQNYMHGSSGPGGTTLIALHAERGPGGEVNLSWNRNLPGLSAAQTASLTIFDGPYHRDVAIDPEQLRFGRLTYFAQTDDVQFHFEIYLGDDRSLAENLHVVAPGYGAPISNGAPLTDLPMRRDFAPEGRDGYRPGIQPVRSLNGDFMNHGDSLQPLHSGVRKVGQLSIPGDGSTVKASAVTAIAEPVSSSVSNQKVFAAPAASAPSPSLEGIERPEIAWNGGSQAFEIHSPLPAQAPPPTVEALPASVTPLPAHRTAETRIPPRPIRQVLPNTKLFGRSLVRDVVTLEVAVIVDEQGVVTTARALNPKAVGSFLAAQALSAARDWKFEPAQVGDRSVASTYTILFRFHP
jgi:hypothetical protein